MKAKLAVLMIAGFLPILACNNPIIEHFWKTPLEIADLEIVPVVPEIPLVAPEIPPAVIHIVTFESNGGSTVDAQVVGENSTASRPDDPSKNGYDFVNWYRDPELTDVYDFDTLVTDGITLYAKWKPANLTSAKGHELVWIPAGTFTMGSPTTEPGRGTNTNEETQHQVTLTSGFYMGKYEVTQAQYEAVMGSNPSYFHGGSGRAPAAGETQANRPVEQVSWYDALVFCNKLSLLEGLSPVYRINGNTDPSAWGDVPTINNATWSAVEIVANATGYRLPTEAQWEYACRAGTTTAFNTGDTRSDNTGWHAGNSGSRTHEVGLKPANAWGLYDMHGNVEELCFDRYGPYTSDEQTDPTGPVSGNYRVTRGGSWDNYSLPQHLRSACREQVAPYARNGVGTGFRLVRQLTPVVTIDDEDFHGESIHRRFGVSNTAEWNEAVSAISGGGDNKNYIITVIADFTVDGRTTASFGSVTGIKVSLRGAGRTLTLTGNGSMLRAESGQTLILRDLTLRGHNSNNAPLVYVSGTNSGFIMQSGTISGNSAYNEGGGVYVDDNGTFTMSGGAISGNSAYNGGGVCVCDSGASFTMYGGEIFGNKADNMGGGVYVGFQSTAIFGTFRIVTGTIYGSSEVDTTLRNTAKNTSSGPALYKFTNSTAQYGKFNGATWSKTGDLNTTNNTIKVTIGVLQ